MCVFGGGGGLWRGIYSLKCSESVTGKIPVMSNIKMNGCAF